MELPILVKVDGDNVNKLKVISEVELTIITEAKSEIFTFNREYQLLDYVNENYNAFLRELNKMVNDFNSGEQVLSPFVYDEFIRFINRSILNLLTSMRTMTDHLEAKVKRSYGKNSDECKLLKKHLSNAFDTGFSYCFASKLRNFVQHSGMPPFRFDIDNRFDSEDITCKVLLEFDRDELLSGYDSWGGIVKPKLEAQEEYFCAFTIIDSLVKKLFKVYACFMQETTLQKVQNSRDRILNYINEPKGYASNDYAIGYFKPGEDKRLSIELSWIPASLFAKIESIEMYL